MNLNIFKKIKFEKSGMPIIPVCFFAIIVLSLLGILITIKSNLYRFELSGFSTPLENIYLTFESKEKLDSKAYMICYEDYCKSPNTDAFINYYYSSFDRYEEEFYQKKTGKILFAMNDSIKGFPDNITSLNLNVGNKNIYLNNEEIKKLERKEIKIQILNEKNQKEIVKYNTLILPPVNNHKGFMNHLFNIILSLFYNWQMFIFPYCWIILAFIMFIFNRDEFKFQLQFNKKICLSVFFTVMVLGIFLRFVNLNYFPISFDELALKCCIFKDFSIPIMLMRFFSFIFGILFIIYTYLLFKNISKKDNSIIALFGAFLASFNLINIYQSNRITLYSLPMFTVVAFIYHLFKYLENPNKKSLLTFSLFNILALNINLYTVLLSIVSYIWGSVDLLQNKKNKDIKYFTIAYIVAFIFAIPRLIILFKNISITALSHETLLDTINLYFANKYIFIALSFVILINLIFSYTPQKLLEKINVKINKNRENLFLYLVYSITSVLILICAIKVFDIKELLSIYSLLFLLEITGIVSILDFVKENKFTKTLKMVLSVVLTACYFSITAPIMENKNIDSFMDFVKNDIKQYENDYEIHLIHSYKKEYLKRYPEIYNDSKIQFHNTDKKLNKIRKDDYILKKGVIYFDETGVDINEISKFNPNLRIYKNNQSTGGKLIFN